MWVRSLDFHGDFCLVTGCFWHMVTLSNPPDPIYRQVTNATVRETTGFLPVSSLIPGCQLTSLGMWHEQIPSTFTIKPLVHCFDHYFIGEDLKGDQVHPGWANQCWCTINRHLDPLSLEEGWWPYFLFLTMYHQHDNTPVVHATV